MSDAAKTFTDDELAYVRTIRSHEIRVVDGKLTVWFPVSDEYAAKSLHDLLRPEALK